ncbi:hypothetical protein [Actinoplanes utahensis]|uniref:Ricin B lectin domain-containing protein n=1 Tax=Actinoplanes utahensis TaxID=1869 RepID=A0A0A6UCT0_ACTUT|nr:hypothetical protein [Actinoplanes utahensis]KHD72873.1 hypothetical protein MB27_37845 [Actinoplanes utahensis]GIF35089.1 hypothetical protein Aut01nite_80750 [Actinoplanes utahensis]
MIKLPNLGGDRRNDDGSMPIAMLIAIVGVSLSALLTTMVTTRISDTGLVERRVLALHAAQAGLDVGLGQVRSAELADSRTGEVSGAVGLLPCRGAMTGTVGAGNTSAYTVSVVYYAVDPQGKTDAWLADARNQVPCAAGGSGTSEVPSFARFTAVGTAAGPHGTLTRTLSGTYVLHTTNANIYGGLVRAYKTTTTGSDYCIAAPALTATHPDWAVGEAVTMQTCSPGALEQTWTYNDTLQYVLTASQTPSRTLGLCLDSVWPRSTTLNPNDSAPVTLQTCQATAPAKYRQMWSLNSSSLLLGTNIAGDDLSSTACLYRAGGQANNDFDGDVLMSYGKNGCGATADRRWQPDAAVGAGMAGSDAGRKAGMVVNYKQFGRCLDVTDLVPTKTFLISWPCKQNPKPEKVDWNQKWTLPKLPSDTDPSAKGTSRNKVKGVITDYVTKGDFIGTSWCLQSPMVAGGYVRMIKAEGGVCEGGNNQKWTVFGHTDKYATSYQIQDGTGELCMGPRDSAYFSPADLYNNTSKIQMTRCDGSTLQKWNADKNVIEALALKDVKETE